MISLIYNVAVFMHMKEKDRIEERTLLIIYGFPVINMIYNPCKERRKESSIPSYGRMVHTSIFLCL